MLRTMKTALFSNLKSDGFVKTDLLREHQNRGAEKPMPPEEETIIQKENLQA